jgi:flavin reductase (DIM6/NTAB) family NADH-FMN oxidoreductase RutF
VEIEPEQAFRRAMGVFATGVTVVSAARDDGALSGITVNSLTSVSLRPRLLLWCLGDASARYDIFAAAEVWGVTMLGADEEALALRFTRAETEGIAPAEAEMFAGAPVLKAGMAHLSCRTHERRVAGDHLIIIGEVIDFRARSGPALTFFRGRYGRIEDPWS